MSNNNNAESNNETNFEFEDLSSLHHYRTELPNIIFEMDLDPYEFKAYCVLKKTAGDKGRCFKSIDTLCKEIGCGKTKFSEIKESLKNKNLIKILKRKHENGGNMPDLISMIDIWPLNMRTMSEKYSKKEKEKPGSEGGIPGEGGGSPKIWGGVRQKHPKKTLLLLTLLYL